MSALLYHIVPGSQTAEQLLAFGTLPTELANVTLTVSRHGSQPVSRLAGHAPACTAMEGRGDVGGKLACALVPPC